MNVNEVVANLAARLAGKPAGDYAFVHPNEHVNLGHSTNDVVPTAMKLAVFRVLEGASIALVRLAEGFSEKKKEYSETLRLGRTCLQDAVPMLFGQTFGGYQAVIQRHAKHLEELRRQLLTVRLGGTAVGTGLSSRPELQTGGLPPPVGSGRLWGRTDGRYVRRNAEPRHVRPLVGRTAKLRKLSGRSPMTSLCFRQVQAAVSEKSRYLPFRQDPRSCLARSIPSFPWRSAKQHLPSAGMMVLT